MTLIEIIILNGVCSLKWISNMKLDIDIRKRPRELCIKVSNIMAFNCVSLGLPWWLSVLKNLPANAGDASSVPGLGKIPHAMGAAKPRHHNSWAYAQTMSHNSWAHVPQLLKPVCPKASSLQQEKPLQWEACAVQWRVPPLMQLEESQCSNEVQYCQ